MAASNPFKIKSSFLRASAAKKSNSTRTATRLPRPHQQFQGSQDSQDSPYDSSPFITFETESVAPESNTSRTEGQFQDRFMPDTQDDSMMDTQEHLALDTQEHLTFFTFPREIRDEIYKCHISNFEPFDSMSDKVYSIQGLKDKIDIEASQFRSWPIILRANRQVNEEFGDLFYKHVFPALNIKFTNKRALKAFRVIRKKHPNLAGSVELKGGYADHWDQLADKRIDGVLKMMRKDILLKGELHISMSDKSDMLYSLAWERREAKWENFRSYVFGEPGWKVEVGWKKDAGCHWTEHTTLKVTGNLGYVDALWNTRSEAFTAATSEPSSHKVGLNAAYLHLESRHSRRHADDANPKSKLRWD